MDCLYYEESIILKHNHPGRSKEKDETYLISERNFWRYDQDLKHYRQENVDLLDKKNYYDYL